jgi:VanZ family protein
VKRLLYWLPAVLIMIMIYIFSSKPADISSQSSMTITDVIYSVYETISGQEVVGADRENALMNLNGIIRKLAHITEYALLSMSIAWPLWVTRPGLKGYKLAILTIGITIVYAATDEYHQTFVPGRSGEIRDVLIDSIGACIGFVIFKLLLFIASFSKKDRNK